MIPDEDITPGGSQEWEPIREWAMRCGIPMIPYGGITLDSEELRTAGEYSIRYGVPIADLPNIIVPPEVLALVPATVAVEQQILPLSVDNGSLEVIVSDPSIPDLRDRLSELLKMNITLAVTPPTWLKSAITLYYGDAIS